MPTKTAIKADMEFNQLMTNLVDVLKGIAASQFQSLRKLKTEKMEQFDNYFRSFFQFIDLVAAPEEGSKASGVVAAITITSELGFMGALNAKMCNKALETVGDNNCEIIVLGKKGAAKLKSSGKKITVFPGIDQNKRYEQALELKKYVMEKITSGEFRKVDLIYANPVSFSSQTIEVLSLYPATDLFDKQEKVTLEKGKQVFIESKIEDIRHFLFNVWMTMKFYETFFDNKLAEYAAQSMQLEGSMQYLEDEGKMLKIKYNKARREAIDAEMREVFSSMLVTGNL